MRVATRRYGQPFCSGDSDVRRLEKRIDTGAVLVTGENMREPEIQALLSPKLDEYLR